MYFENYFYEKYNNMSKKVTTSQLKMSNFASVNNTTLHIMKYQSILSLMKGLVLTGMLVISQLVFAAPVRLTGSVKDAAGEPLIGASILVGDGVGAITDLDGNFVLENVASEAVLTVSYVGYKDVQVPVNGRTHIDIVLESDDLILDDVVVIGYGVQRKSNVTGAISSVKAEDFQNKPITNAASALQGKVSGVQVINNSGAPGASPTIRVRGYSSNGSSNPLYIVDGLKVSDISYLDPSSIKSMEILKDAASAAIYGAEAGNGVIMITTKGGEKGSTRVSFDSQWTWSSLAKRVDLMNAEQFTNYYTEAGGDAFTSQYFQHNIAGTDTDWQKEMYETGLLQKYNLGVQGGTDQGGFFLALGYTGNNGMIKMDKDRYQRINAQLNANYTVRPWLEVGSSNNLSYIISSTLSESNVQYGQMKDILLADPLTPVYYASLPSSVQEKLNSGMHPVQTDDGRYYGMSWIAGGANNPLANVQITNTENRGFYLNGMTHVNLKPFKNFVFTSRVGYTFGSMQSGYYNPTRMTSFTATTDTPLSLVSTQTATIYYQWENFANYVLQTGKAGDFGFMLGMSYSDANSRVTGGQTNALSSEDENFRYLSYSTNAADDYVSGDVTLRRQIAYYGRLSWDWRGRYNAQFNFRADSYDSAYLDLSNSWGFFPSASIGWTFSEEPFMKNVKGDVFSFGKLRASWGINGSISNLGGYMYNATLRTGQANLATNTANTTYFLDGVLYQGTYPGSVLANPNLRWEQSKQLDLGLDLRFFNSRLTAAFDYFHKTTDGLLVASTAPYITGTTAVYQNLGIVTNDGLELELEWRDSIGDFNYGIKGNISTVKNVVKAYRGEGTRINGASMLQAGESMTYFEEGYPVWYIRGYKLKGVDASTGAAIYEDTDGKDGITDSDRTYLGKAIPDYTYGITLTASWKGLDFSVYGAGSQGNQLIYGMMPTSTDNWTNRPAFLYNGRWTASSASGATLPSAMYQRNDPRFYNSDAFVFDASFFKIKQIQLGYTFPKSLLQRMSIDSVRAFLSMDNWFTFTKYPGSDPEVNAAAAAGASALAFDYGGYPLAKSLSVGINVAF